MITARAQKNAVTAKQYYGEHLARSDYYSEGRRSEVRWFGLGCERLGLRQGAGASLEAFERMCENQHPVTGEKLTVRHRTNDRRVCFDFVASAPKSVSILALVMGDGRLIEAHQVAARAAMCRMEQQARARVRTGGQDGERTTGELIAVSVTHGTSRALDPQLHTHFVAFNATWDPVEERWKALQATAMYEKMNFFTEVYRSELGSRLRALGYRLRSTTNGFEIEGVPTEILMRFSKRRRDILAAEAQLSGKLGKPISNNARATLAQATRNWKDLEQSAPAILAYQRSQLTPDELAALERLILRPGAPVEPPPPEITAQQALNHARDHVFERSSVVSRHALLREALAYGRGFLTVDPLQAALSARPDFIEEGDRLTTVDMLQRERELIRKVNASLGGHAPVGADKAFEVTLDAEQSRAVRVLLQSSDGIQVLRGSAGAGKSRVLRAVEEVAYARGLPTLLLAPTQSACQALRQSGGKRVMTLQAFLDDPVHRSGIRCGMLLVDEAGLLSVREMSSLVKIASESGCRMVLCGDTRQHSGVGAGDALRLIEERSAVPVVDLGANRRQAGQGYRLAIDSLAAGRLEEGFDRLASMGAVVETDEDNRYGALVAEYLESRRRSKSALIVSPTWQEIREVTAEVREAMKRTGELGPQETVVTVHESLNWTHAQRCDFRNYRPGQFLRFHRDTAGHRRGETVEVAAVGKDAVTVRRADGTAVEIRRKQTGCFDVMEARPLPVAVGEVLLIRANRKDAGLFNGQSATVREIRPDGSLGLGDGRSIPPDFRVFTHGYCVTSVAAQGRTVDHVYVAVGSESMAAANRNQFYVSTSRGRQKVKVYTDDVETLRGMVRRDGARTAAVELAAGRRVARQTQSQRVTGMTAIPGI